MIYSHITIIVVLAFRNNVCFYHKEVGLAKMWSDIQSCNSSKVMQCLSKGKREIYQIKDLLKLLPIVELIMPTDIHV